MLDVVLSRGLSGSLYLQKFIHDKVIAYGTIENIQLLLAKDDSLDLFKALRIATHKKIGPMN